MILAPDELELALPPDDTETCVPYGEHPLRRESAAILADGRVIYVFREGDSIKQGYAANEAVFYTNGSVGSVTTILSGLTGHSSAVFSTPEGGLYLLVAQGGGGVVATVKCYRSPSALGDDWVLQGDVQVSDVVGNGGFGFDSYVVSAPHVYPGGRWVFAGPRYDHSSFLFVSHAKLGVWVTADHGVTWNRSFEACYFFGCRYGIGNGRNIGETLGDTLWWSSTGDVEGNQSAYSTDTGDDWTTWYTGEGEVTYFAGDEDGYLYRMVTDGVVQRALDPIAGPWGTYRTYDLFTNDYAPIVQRLSATWMVSSAGKMLVMGLGAGWVVGRVSLD